MNEDLEETFRPEAHGAGFAERPRTAIVVHQRPQAAFLGTPQATGLRHDTLDRSPNTASSLPPDDEAQRFADFFLQGSHNLRQYNAEYDDIGAAVD